jgi:hypothetical protein
MLFKTNTFFCFILFSGMMIISFSSCKSKEQVAGNKEENEKGIHIETIHTGEGNDLIKFEIRNTSSQDVRVFHPKEITIEKKNGDWEKVSVLYCPCGASCPPPPEFLVLKPGELLTISWNKKRSWCGERQANGIREYHEEKVESGLYRLKVHYADLENEMKTVYNVFNINH